MDEIEQALALDVTPASWSIAVGRDFLGTHNLFADALLLFERGVHDRVTEPVRCNGLDDPQLPRLLLKQDLAKSREGRGLRRAVAAPDSIVARSSVEGGAVDGGASVIVLQPL